jgi:hypothetical protein
VPLPNRLKPSAAQPEGNCQVRQHQQREGNRVAAEIGKRRR